MNKNRNENEPRSNGQDPQSVYENYRQRVEQDQLNNGQSRTLAQTEQDLINDKYPYGTPSSPQYQEQRTEAEQPQFSRQGSTSPQPSQQNSQQPESSQLTPPSSRKKNYHIGRWIAGIIVAAFLLLGFGIYHEVHELSNTQRTQDTMLDQAIKNQTKKLAEEKAPAAVRPQIIKIINTTPLSKLQQAANDQAVFNQIAQQNGIPEQYIQAANQNWFKNQQVAQTRDAIQQGQLIKAAKDLQNLDFSHLNSNSSGQATSTSSDTSSSANR